MTVPVTTVSPAALGGGESRRRRWSADLGGRWRQGRGPAVVFGAAVVAEVVLSALVASSGVLVGGHWRFVVLLGAWTAAFAVGMVGALHLRSSRAVGLIVVAGLAVRLAALAGPPTTSDDLYRYAWDGRVQAAGIDPYGWPPTAPQLDALRERWLWPDRRGCAALGRPAGCTRINRPAVRTIYPPLAEAFFAAVYRLGGIGSRAKAWQVAGLVADTMTLALLAVALGRWGRDRRWLALYALCPAPALEFVNNGHVDALAVAFVAAAFVVARPPGLGAPRSAPFPDQASWRHLGASGLLAAAALVKLYPALLLLPLVASQPERRLRAAGWSAAITTAAFGVAYAPHVAAVGTKVLGYLPGYLAEEHYRSGGRFLVAGLIGVPDRVAGAVTVATLAAVAAWIVRRRPPLPDAAGIVFAAALLAASPAQPWYSGALLALATVAAWPALAVAIAAAYGAALPIVLAPNRAPTLGGISYAAAAAAIAAGCLLRRRRSWNPATVPEQSWAGPGSTVCRARSR